MEGPLSYEEAQQIVAAFICAECWARLGNPWGGAYGVDGYIVRCIGDVGHRGIKPKGRETRRLFDPEKGWVEYDIMTQRPIDQFEEEGLMLRKEIPEVNGIMAAPVAVPTRPMTIDEFDQRMDLIEHVVERMTLDVHYGVIPGTRDKSLWEPGAEYLRAAFNIAWGHEFIEEHEDYRPWADGGWRFRYKVRAFQWLAPGVEGPAWIASADNRERKFWCSSDCPRPCTQQHEPSMEREMHPHNVRDRALKRAFVALIRNVTGTTGYFKGAMVSEDAQRITFKCEEHNRNWQRHERDGRVWYSHKQGQGYHNATKEQTAQFEAGALDKGDVEGEEGYYPDYTIFFNESREVYGKTPDEALTILGVKDWNAWTRKGESLDSAREKMAEYHKERDAVAPDDN